MTKLGSWSLDGLAIGVNLFYERKAAHVRCMLGRITLNYMKYKLGGVRYPEYEIAEFG